MAIIGYKHEDRLTTSLTLATAFLLTVALGHAHSRTIRYITSIFCIVNMKSRSFCRAEGF